MAYFAGGTFGVDPWAAGAADRAILTPADWREQRDGDATAGDETTLVGLKLDPGFAVETIAADVARFALITVAFPKFTDGRGYSMGWLLRSRYGYRNELRAVGDILFDEMQLMARCGFDAFEIEDADTLRLLRIGRRATFDRFYQPGLEPEMPEGTRPWARRLAPPSGNLA